MLPSDLARSLVPPSQRPTSLTQSRWNPAIQEQAFDRAHRFGQTEDVKIYIPTISGTIEDRLLTLQKTKSETAKAALDGGALTSSKLSTADIMYLFRGNGEGQNDGARA